jgi:septal ring factor EnvC (AmiA/AmiB activator)
MNKPKKSTTVTTSNKAEPRVCITHHICDCKQDQLTALTKENKELRVKLSFTNSGWPHEKKLHEHIASLTARNAKLTTELDSFKKTNGTLVKALEQIAQRKGFALDLVRFQAGDSLASTMKNIAIEALKANEETPK